MPAPPNSKDHCSNKLAMHEKKHVFEGSSPSPLANNDGE